MAHETPWSWVQLKGNTHAGKMHTLYKYNVKEEMDSSLNNENAVIIYSIPLTSFKPDFRSSV